MMKVTLPDGTEQEVAEGSSGLDIAESIGPRLAAAAVAVKLDGDLLDLTRPLPNGGAIELITESTDEGRAVLRHSAAHVLAQAVLDLFEGATFAIGPSIEDGFYYDFDIGRPFTPEDVERIEGRMAEIIAQDQPFVRDEVSRAGALELFADQPFKSEIIESVDSSEVESGESITLYRNNGFFDLCRGPHVPTTGRLKAVKLLRSAGAYWRGDENKAQLQRIYGTAWEDKAALDEYLNHLEEARRRDHRRIGPELDLFSFPPELGSGLALWHPKGGILRKEIEDYSRRTHEAHDYDIVFTPHVAKANLWETSGHLQFYAENMYPEMVLDAGQRYYVKPMNCPFHILIYRSRGRSYRELPLRIYELGTVYRNERSGVVHGLLRVRGLTMDDSHIFITESQIGDELANLLEFTLMVLRDFGFEEFEADLSTRDPEKMMGDPDLWDKAEDALKQALEKAGMSYQVAEGDAAFYGPKIDIHLKDAIGRRWQMSTLQVDFVQPQNFDLDYATNVNTRQRPVMIHRALMGSIERFVGVLTEHYAGAFPVWLSPVQATVVPVADRHADYAGEVAAQLKAKGVRVEVDTADDTVGEKIRRAMTHHHPAVLVVGDSDVEARTVGLRLRGSDEEERDIPAGDAAERIAELARPPR
ncbi:MAG: threonine--tRNA ligase [Acidimicrobiia bacterium]|nr:threonine--tRNA ligase [Acidimicrobiia bacterium]